MDKKYFNIPIVDTHIHIWDYSIPRSWLSSVPSLSSDFLLPAYKQYSSELCIYKMILMETAVDEGYQLKEAEWFSNQKIDGVAGMVISLPMKNGAQISDDLSRVLSSNALKVVAVREVLQDKPFDYCLNAEFIAAIGILNSQNLPFEICVRSDKHLESVFTLASKFPTLKFMINHCGKPDLSKKDPNRINWYTQMAKLATLPNTHCKVSGLLSEIGDYEWKQNDLVKVLKEVIELWGWDRCHYGSDWPLCAGKISHKDYVDIIIETIMSMGGGLKEMEKVLGTNSLSFYNL